MENKKKRNGEGKEKKNVVCRREREREKGFSFFCFSQL